MMRVLLLVLSMTCLVHTLHSQFSAGAGIVFEKNDYQTGLQGHIQYQMLDGLAVRASGDYFLCCNAFDDFYMLNLDIGYDLFRSQKQNVLSTYIGYNVYPGIGYKYQGQTIRGPLLTGINIGFEYRRHIFGQWMFINTKYIHGGGYRNLIGAIGVRWRFGKDISS